MSDILYATGNNIKFHQAVQTCKDFGINFKQANLKVPEIQGEDSIVIAKDKAAKAFNKFKHAVVISDDSWSIPGLKGFPGPYMKSINDWFSVDDWLHLTQPLTDRRIIVKQIVIYQDETGQQVFSCDIEGILLREARGKSPYSHSTITSFDGGKQANAEFHERGLSAPAPERDVWHDFAEWYVSRGK